MNSSVEAVTFDVDAKRTSPTPRAVERLISRRATRLMIAALLLHGGYASGQNGSQNHPKVQVQRDERGVAAITRALNAMGGVAAFSALNDTETQANCTRTSKTKSDTHTVRWITSGDYFLFDGGEKDHRGIVNGPGGSSRMMNGKTVAVSDRSMRAMKPIYLPGLLLHRALTNPVNQIEILDDETVDGTSAIHVRITDTKFAEDAIERPEEDWFFDPQTGLPLRLAYSGQVLNSLLMFVRTTVQYSGFTSFQGVAVPGTVLRSFEGGPKTSCAVTSFSFNQNPDPSTFSAKAGGSR